MEEYDRTDAELYDSYATWLDGDVAFYVAEAREAGGPVLEIGCGTGRILIPTAEAGVDITGLDRAPSMLAVARRKLDALEPATRERITLVEGDMRSFSLERRYDLITIPFRAFLCLPSTDDQKVALCRLREHLTDDGRLILNVFDPRLDIIQAQCDARGSTVQQAGEFTHPETGRKVMFWDTRRYDPETQILECYFIFEELDDTGRVVGKTYVPLTLRWVYRYEMQHLLELCGFAVEALYGDFDRGPFRYGGEQIWVARKA